MQPHTRQAALAVLPLAVALLGSAGGPAWHRPDRPDRASLTLPADAAAWRAMHRVHQVCQQQVQAQQRGLPRPPGGPTQSPAWWQAAQAALDRCLRDRLPASR